MAKEQYLVPKRRVSSDDIDEVLADMGASEQDAEEGIEKAWQLGRARVRLFEDSALFLEQLVVDGPGNEDVAARLRERLPTYSPRDMPVLFEEIADRHDKQTAYRRTLAILASVAPETADPRLVELFQLGFNHEDPLVREQAAAVATIPGWPELRADVERLTHDTDDHVNQTAAIALGELDK